MILIREIRTTFISEEKVLLFTVLLLGGIYIAVAAMYHFERMNKKHTYTIKNDISCPVDVLFDLSTCYNKKLLAEGVSLQNEVCCEN